MGSGSSAQCKVLSCFQCQVDTDTEFYCNTSKHDLCLQCKERHATNFLTKHKKAALFKALTKQYKVRRCSQCQGDTEFYCNTCNHELCLQCKERHVIGLDTMYHDVVIYREKYKYISKQEFCLSHPDNIYKKYCYTCKVSLCSKCKEQKHIRHKILDIRTAYKTNREQHRNIIHRIRSEILYQNQFLLADIKTDLKTDKTGILNFHLNILRLKGLIVIEKCAVIVRYKRLMIHKLQQQKKIMKRQLVSIENFDHRYEKSTNRALKFLFFLKNMNIPKIKDICNFTPLALISLIEEMNLEDASEFPDKIQILGEVREECLLELLSTPVLYRSVKLTNSGDVTHISCVNSDQIWISDHSFEYKFSTRLILTNTDGYTLDWVYNEQYSFWYFINGTHTVNKKGELIYIVHNNKIYKRSAIDRPRSESTLIKRSDPWQPRCVCSSPINGDLLVGMFSYVEVTCKVNRYNNTGQHIQTIQHDKTGQELYIDPRYITENRNGDVIVSDYVREAVVVTDHRGRYRFSYTGPPSGAGLSPWGICTDALSHILVCDRYSNSVHMIDKDGNFLSKFLTKEQGINTPLSLGYDNKSHLLWVGSSNKTVCAYRYLKRKIFDTEKRNS